MTVTQIETTQQEITQSIDRKELKQAIEQLRTFISKTLDWQAEEELMKCETTYRYMLQYFAEGNPDPEREKVYLQLIAQLYVLVDNAADGLFLKESPSYYFDRKRYLNYSSRSSLLSLKQRIEKGVSDQLLSELMDDDAQRWQTKKALMHAYDTDLSELFLVVWLSNRWSDEENEVATDLIGSAPSSALCLMASAVTLSLLRRFDESKCLWLIAASSSTDEELRQRALVGVLLIFSKYTDRIQYYPSIRHRFEALAESGSIVTDCRNIVLHFIRSRETEKISRKLTDEILPEMMKISPILRQKMNLEDWKHEVGDEDQNPDWQEIFEKSGINDKMKELSELQMEGSDVYMTTFSALKSFPFFYNISNWFLPFTLEHSDLYSLVPPQHVQNGLISKILEAGVLCNSDKYSLGFSLMQMPEAQREMLVQQFAAESEQLGKLKAENDLLTQNNRGNDIAKQYIQDLYRFFKLNPHRTDFFDIFNLPLTFYQLPLLAPILSDSDSLRIMAEFCFRKELYSDAIVLYQKWSEKESDSSEIYQKVGYCFQKLDNDQEALKAYLRADTITPDSAWTIRRIAQCYRRMKQPEMALTYYTRYDQLSPDNLNVILNIGHCYLEQKNYGEALRYYFKADYLDFNNPKAWRPIAWCSFLAGKYDQAEKYYQKIVEAKPIALDYLNYAHVRWSLGEIVKAIALYRQSIELFDDYDTFKRAYLEDAEELAIAGILPNEQSMMLDFLMFPKPE